MRTLEPPERLAVDELHMKLVASNKASQRTESRDVLAADD
ncbi:hypothetical protein MAUB1S_11386 [Mycolicibacterium aubagnense]